MAATVTISRRNRSIALTLTFPIAAMCAGVAGMVSVRRHGADTAAPYIVPVITLVQPRAGGVVIQDRPVVLFRFSAEQPGDPIDAASFHVTLDGEDRTDDFRISTAEAWGSLAGRAGTAPVVAGSHTIEARVCSVRGICATLTSAIVVQPARWDLPSSQDSRSSPAPAQHFSP